MEHTPFIQRIHQKNGEDDAGKGVVGEGVSRQTDLKQIAAQKDYSANQDDLDPGRTGALRPQKAEQSLGRGGDDDDEYGTGDRKLPGNIRVEENLRAICKSGRGGRGKVSSADGARHNG